MTTYLLSCLHPQTNKRPNPFELDKSLSNLSGGEIPSSQNPNASLQQLPPELLARVMSFLPLTSVLRLRSCCRVLAIRIPLDQRFWYNQLLAGCLVGYLWDLDRTECRVKTGSLIHEGQSSVGWDWARFVKQLWVFKTFEKDGEMARAPAGLRNRRRIWRIVHELLMLDDEQ